MPTLKKNKLSNLLELGYKKFPHQVSGKLFEYEEISNKPVVRERLHNACAVGLIMISHLDQSIIDQLHAGTNGRLRDHINVNGSFNEVINSLNINKNVLRKYIKCQHRDCKYHGIFPTIELYIVHLNDYHGYSIKTIVKKLRALNL